MPKAADFSRRLGLWALIGAGALYAQAAPAGPSFEVASIRPDTIVQSSFDTVPRRSGDRVVMHNTGVAMVIVYAYNLIDTWQVQGNLRLPGDWYWYDIEAIAPGAPNDAELRRMFQTLLADRFGLRFHRESKEVTGYDLVAEKGGAKLKSAVPGSVIAVDGNPIKDGDSLSIYGADGTHFMGKNASMRQLLAALSNRLRAPVQDRTGLTGPFDFNVVFSRDDKPAGVDGPPSLPTALQEQLGLRLVKTKIRADILFVDSISKPSPN